MSKDPRRTSQWRKVRRIAINTKEPVCYICGNNIDVMYGKDPLSVQVDHIIPLKYGGPPFDLDNLTLVHQICNQIKGSRIMGEKVEKTSSMAIKSKLDFKDDYLDWMEE